ncbi:MAG: DNA mismatch repair protein MutL [Bdellovibrionales bacterium]|nr:DNA mismatch repair protein MutL [Bdellovibrionales bacterium]
MKSETAETAQVKAVLKATALSRPDVGFRLKTKGRVDLQFPVASGFLARARGVLGVKLYETAGEFEGLKVEAVFSGPEDVLGNGKGLWFFVQGRWIQDRSLQAAVVEAYRGLLMHGEYPIAAVKIVVPDGEVDVNISPTKSAVKFRDPSRAFRAVSRTLRSALELAPWMQDGTRGAATASGAVPALRDVSAVSAGVKSAVSQYSNQYAMGSTVRGEARSVSEFTRPYRAKTEESEAPGPERSNVEMTRFPGGEDILPMATESSPALDPHRGKWSSLKVIGQAGLTYLVCEDGDKLIFVDQHAAHERVAYERLMRAWREGGIEAQALLIPLVIELEPESLEALLLQTQALAKMGFSIEAMGPRSLAVSSFPALLKESAVKSGLEELAARTLERGGSFVVEEKIGDVFARMACHSVVRAGQALGLEQMRSLLEQMDEFPLSSFCPHGRPVSVEYPYARLERDFGRTV